MHTMLELGKATRLGSPNSGSTQSRVAGEQPVPRAVDQPVHSPEWLTDEQAACLVGVQPRTITGWRKTRGLPFIRIGSRVARIRKADLDAWLGDFHRRQSRANQ